MQQHFVQNQSSNKKLIGWGERVHWRFPCLNRERAKLQEGNFKNENTLKEIIREISDLTGKEVSEEKENKIIEMIINDKVPKDMEKYI